MEYYLGIDNGSSSVKAGLYDKAGNEKYVYGSQVESLIPEPGYCERDMEQLWRINVQVIKTLIQESGVNAADIKAVACCGHGKGIYLWGRGKPVYRGILSSDIRALSYAEQWKRDGTAKLLFKKTKQQILPCHPAALLCWFRDRMPRLASQITRVFTCKDYIRFRLTGKAYADITECCGWGLMNADNLEYDNEILEKLNLKSFRHALPDILRPVDLAGEITREVANLTGLKEGTPVACGLFDIGASALAVNAIKSDKICMIAGTWSINEYIRKTPVMDGSVLMNSVFCELGSYLIEESSPTSATNAEWYLEKLILPIIGEKYKKKIYEIADSWVGALDAGEDCPIYLPFVAGSYGNPQAEAAFVGLHANHDVRHMVRAVYEGVAFAHKYHLERLLESHPSGIKEIHLAGGAANSKAWAEIFAQVCGYPVCVSKIKQTGTLGCAIVGAVAVGDYPDLDTASAEMVHLSEPLRPGEREKNCYNKKYELYKKTAKALDNVWNAFAETRRELLHFS